MRELLTTLIALVILIITSLAGALKASAKNDSDKDGRIEQKYGSATAAYTKVSSPSTGSPIVRLSSIRAIICFVWSILTISLM